jgi:hypothetical protein
MQITEPSFIQKGLDPLVDPHFWITLPDYESARDFLDYAKAELDFYQTQAIADRNYGLFLLYMRLFNTSWGFAINKKVEEAERQNDETLPGVFDFLEYVYHELEKAVKREIAMLELYNKQEKIPHRGVEDDQDNVRFWWSWADDRIRIAFESGLAKEIGAWNDGRDAENRFRVKHGYKGWILFALKCAFPYGHTDREALSYFVDEKGKPFSDITNPSNYTDKSDYERENKIKALFEQVEAHST